jgi:4-hydroxy-3-methylbut-2-enyl diphosphate reductase
MPNRSDLCFATTNRQAALKAIAGEADAVVVIGSANSSNTVALEKVAGLGLPPGAADQRGRRAPRRPLGHGGGSPPGPRPRALVEEVIARLAPRQGVTEVTVTTEDEYFPPPPELRELLRAVGTTLGFLAGPALRPMPTRRPRTGRSRPPTCSTCWPREGTFGAMIDP